MICVVIGRTRHKMILAEVQEAAKRGAAMIELRLDFLAKTPDFKRLLANNPCPMIATVRKPEDGGRWAGTEEARRMLLRHAVVSGFDWVDLETDVAEEIRRFKDVKRIVSYHNLHETPADLEEIYQRMCQQDADVIKMAVTAQHPSDNLRVLNLLREPPKPTIAFCMGDLGIFSRMLGAKLGAPFTYGAFNREYRIAPGIPSFDELQHIYHYDKINAETHVFGVIGDPVAHSLSPLIHNAAFRALNLNAVYLPFRVPRGQLTAFLRDFDKLHVRGYSVTIPHKEAAAALTHQKDEAVTLTRSANTLIRVREGFSGYSTDFQAALESLLAVLSSKDEGGTPTVEHRIALVLGAGGVARAVAHALHRAGALVTITNRTAERAHQLASEVGGRAVDWHGRHSMLCDILINCTSVGMHPNVDESPIHPSYLRPGMVVMDTVYTPETTLMVKEARARGCIVQTGVDMFVRQAALQFHLFTGQQAPLEGMRKLVKRALSPVALPEEA
ncbi:MAG: shikimate dehydrogenase [Gemmataceae bacterium]|nr:shikimate dehydrogenase [Gemmataceae bacterium]